LNPKVLTELNFQASFMEVQEDAYKINRASGFNEPDELIQRFHGFLHGLNLPAESIAPFLPIFEQFQQARAGLKLGLIMGEVGEALEAVRKNKGPDDHIPEFSAEEAECADAVIRLMNYATYRGLRLAGAIIAKNEYNRTRADHKPENRAKEGGKKF
jgi:NTP pyrophosphatase (non-canonical NTP hydrolase)